MNCIARALILGSMALLATSCFDNPEQVPSRAVDENARPVLPDTAGLRSRKPTPDSPEAPGDNRDTLRPGIALGTPD